MISLSLLFSQCCTFIFKVDEHMSFIEPSAILNKSSVATLTVNYLFILSYRMNQGMQQVVEDIKQSGGKAWGYYCDIGSKEDVYRTAKTVEIEVGKVLKKKNYYYYYSTGSYYPAYIHLNTRECVSI